MVLDRRQNFISIQNRDNQWMDFDQILCMYLYLLTRSRLGMLVIYRFVVPTDVKISFPFHIAMLIDGFRLNFV